MLLDAGCVLRKGIPKASLVNQLLSTEAHFFVQIHTYEFLHVICMK